MSVNLLEKSENNQVSVTGKIISGCRFSHEVSGEKFYVIEIEVMRLSGFCDRIPVQISEKLLDMHKDYHGKYLTAAGQFRSYNLHEGEKSRLILSVFAKEICFSGAEPDPVKTNQIYLDGYVCKEPVYRRTPMGREIADLLIAVHRPYGRSDYMPCICWGKNARFSSRLDVGGRVQIWGRIQSRDYLKWTEEDLRERRTAYEVSVSRVQRME